jgi:hypothetical protein
MKYSAHVRTTPPNEHHPIQDARGVFHFGDGKKAIPANIKKMRLATQEI